MVVHIINVCTLSYHYQRVVRNYIGQMSEISIVCTYNTRSELASLALSLYVCGGV